MQVKSFFFFTADFLNLNSALYTALMILCGNLHCSTSESADCVQTDTDMLASFCRRRYTISQCGDMGTGSFQTQCQISRLLAWCERASYDADEPGELQRGRRFASQLSVSDDVEVVHPLRMPWLVIRW